MYITYQVLLLNNYYQDNDNAIRKSYDVQGDKPSKHEKDGNFISSKAGDSRYNEEEFHVFKKNVKELICIGVEKKILVSLHDIVHKVAK